jgi:hypothetical protein
MKTIFIAILTIIVIGCISPFDFDGVGETRFLIVEGGVYEKDSTFIDLKFSDTKFVGGFLRNVTDADVKILENDRIEHSLKYNSKANLFLMQDKTFRGKPGNAYQLLIKLSDGREFRSTKDTLLAIEQPLAINDLLYEGNSKIDISAKIGPRKNKPEHYLFRFINYKRPNVCAECPSKDTYRLTNSNECSSPFKECVEIQNGSNWNEPYGFNCINANTCWNFKKLRLFVPFSDALLQATTEREVRLINIPISSFSRYFVETYQYRISQQAYDYFSSLRDIDAKTGTLFDSVPTFLAGNVSSSKNINDKSLGYFVVAGQKIKGHFVDRTLVKSELQEFDPEMEYKEPTLFLAPPLTQLGCTRPPLANCQPSKTRTDKEPEGWIIY